MSGSWWSGPYDHRGVAYADSRDGSPNGFHILEVDGVSYKTRFVPAKEPNGRQIRLSVESRFHHAEKEIKYEYRPGQLQRLADLAREPGRRRADRQCFRWRTQDQGHDGIGDRAPIEMTRRAMPDPFVEDLFARNEATRKPWIKAEVSSHMWTARLPADLATGAHRVVVEAVTEDGDAVAGRMALEVVG